MSSRNPISDILTRINLAHDKKLATKAQSLLQQVSAKVSSTKNAGNAMAVACIQLACETWVISKFADQNISIVAA